MSIFQKKKPIYNWSDQFAPTAFPLADVVFPTLPSFTVPPDFYLEITSINYQMISMAGARPIPGMIYTVTRGSYVIYQWISEGAIPSPGTFRNFCNHLWLNYSTVITNTFCPHPLPLNINLIPGDILSWIPASPLTGDQFNDIVITTKKREWK